MTCSNIPPIKIGNLEMSLIQGGMGVGISGARLASAVANEGGAGTIASVGLGVIRGHVNEEMKKVNKLAPNKQEQYARAYALAHKYALIDEIRAARRKTNGVLAVNIMHVLTDYSELVKAAVEENIDMIVSGAGVPRDLPNYLNGKDIKLIPIVSSGRLATMMCASWARLGHPPDAIVVEGPMAGGHLGYNRAELDNPDFVEHGLEKIIPEVIAAVKPYGNIPVIAAGGIFYGWDIKKYIELGAAGVQMATRFVTTHECDADERFKQSYLDCRKENIVIINSPVGMPGRAIKNGFLSKVDAGEKIPVSCPYHCLRTCIPENSPYCIAKALISAQKGEFHDGFPFAGSNAYLCKEIVSVKQVMADLDREYSEQHN